MAFQHLGPTSWSLTCLQHKGWHSLAKEWALQRVQPLPGGPDRMRGTNVGHQGAAMKTYWPVSPPLEEQFVLGLTVWAAWQGMLRAPTHSGQNARCRPPESCADLPLRTPVSALYNCCGGGHDGSMAPSAASSPAWWPGLVSCSGVGRQPPSQLLCSKKHKTQPTHNVTGIGRNSWRVVDASGNKIGL